MVLRAHRVPGMEDADVPSPGQVLRMATVGGAATTPYGSRIGTLAVGKAADLVLIDWDKLAYPISTRKPRSSTPSSSAPRPTASTSSWWRARSSTKAAVSPVSTRTRPCANYTNHCSMRSATTRSSGAFCRRRCYPVSGDFTPAISIPKRMRLTTGRARGSEASNHVRRIDASTLAPAGKSISFPVS